MTVEEVFSPQIKVRATRDLNAAYLGALPTAVGYRVDGGSLALLGADGTYVVSYTRAAQP